MPVRLRPAGGHASGRAAGCDPGETLERFRRVVTSTTKPPLPIMAMLGEAIVHGEDIRRPLGIHRSYPIQTITRVA